VTGFLHKYENDRLNGKAATETVAKKIFAYIKTTLIEVKNRTLIWLFTGEKKAG